MEQSEFWFRVTQWATRIVPFVFAALLLLPLAWIFWSMLRFQPQPEAERRAELEAMLERKVEEEKARMLAEEKARDPDGVGACASGFAIQLWTETKIGLFPTPFATKWLGYTPRKWVGFIGLAAIAVILVLIIISTFVPIVTTVGNSDGWESDEPPAGADR
jgi:hypothetical protein